MRKLILALLTILLLSGAQEAMSQMNRRQIQKNNKRMMTYRGRKSFFGKEKVYSMIGFSVNALNYYGDLAPTTSKFSTDISFTRPAIGISFGHRFGPRYTLTANFMYGAIKGSDQKSADAADLDNGVYRYRRNLSFRNRIQELSIVASIDLFENQATYISRVAWTPYIFGGVAVFHHNPQAKAPATDLQGNPLPEAGKWVNLQPLGTEGQYAVLQKGDSTHKQDANYGIKPYKRIQISIPIGIGVRFRLNEVFDISGELGFRYLFTDYIDDVSKSYVDLGVLDSELAKAMSYRTNEILPPDHSYKGRDGQTYKVLSGYGEEFTDDKGNTNMRGSKTNKDFIMVTTVKLTYILGKSFHRAKFR